MTAQLVDHRLHADHKEPAYATCKQVRCDPWAPEPAPPKAMQQKKGPGICMPAVKPEQEGIGVHMLPVGWHLSLVSHAMGGGGNPVGSAPGACWPHIDDTCSL